jgi:hypothetical protein
MINRWVADGTTTLGCKSKRSRAQICVVVVLRAVRNVQPDRSLVAIEPFFVPRKRQMLTACWRTAVSGTRQLSSGPQDNGRRGLVLLDGISDGDIAGLFGLSRGDGYGTAEREEPELLALATPGLPLTSSRLLNSLTTGGIGA